MNQQEKLYRVGVFGHFAHKNLGNEATLMSAIQNLRWRIPNIELIGLTLKPAETCKRYDIKSFPIRYDKSYFNSKLFNGQTINQVSKEVQTSGFYRPSKSFLVDKIQKYPTAFGFLYILRHLKSEIKLLHEARELLKNMDALIVCGCNQLDDCHSGPWGHPYTLLKWTYLAKLSGTAVFFVSVGASSPLYPLSQWMLNKALVRADYLSLRDKGSLKLIEEQIPGLKGEVYPDLVHSMKLNLSNSPDRKKLITVAVNPMPVFDYRYWYEDRPKKYEAYIIHLAYLVNHVSKLGYAVNLFNNHPKDLLAINDLMAKLQQMPDVNMDKVCVNRNETIQDLVDSISEADIVVATRFHATVLPLRFGKPVLGIYYETKSKEFLEDVGLDDYYVDINDFSGGDLIKRFDAICKNMDSVQKKLESQYQRYKELMDEQWDRLADLIKR